MRRIFFAISAFVFGLSLSFTPTFAGPATDSLILCLSDKTTGRDRKDLVRWMFVSLSVHPEITALSAVKPEERDQLDKTTASLLDRLLTESCKDQTREAIKTDGPNSIRDAFDRIGRLAMQELMGDPAVAASFTRFSRYLNQDKFKQLHQ